MFDVLYYNNVIKEFEGKYCFRHSFWVYYFAAMEMYRPDSELKEYILKLIITFTIQKCWNFTQEKIDNDKMQQNICLMTLKRLLRVCMTK